MASDTEDGMEDVILGSDPMPLSEFIRQYASKLPQIVITRHKLDGILRSIPPNKVLMVSHKVQHKSYRLKCKKSSGEIIVAAKCSVDIEPLNGFGIAGKKEKFCDFMSRQKKKEMNQKIKFSPLELKLRSSPGPMTVQEIIEQSLVIVHPLQKNSVVCDPVGIPIGENQNVQLLKGHREMSRSDWLDLLETCKMALEEGRHQELPENNYYCILSPEIKLTIVKKKQNTGQDSIEPTIISKSPRASESKSGAAKNAATPRQADATRRAVQSHRDVGRGDSGAQIIEKRTLSMQFKEPHGAKNLYHIFYRKGKPTLISARGSNADDYRPTSGDQFDRNVPEMDAHRRLAHTTSHQPQAKINGLRQHERTSRSRKSYEDDDSFGKNNNNNNNRSPSVSSSSSSRNKYQETVSQTRKLQITDGYESDETFVDSRINRTFVAQEPRRGKYLRVPSFQHDRLGGPNRVQNRRGQNSKSLSDLSGGIPFEAWRNEASDADVENESQITVVHRRPTFRDGTEQARPTNHTRVQSQLVPSGRAPTAPNDFGVRSDLPAGRSIDAEYYRVVSGITFQDAGPVRATAAREQQPRLISSRHPDSAQSYVKSTRAAVAASRYDRPYKHSSDADFSGSEDTHRYAPVDRSYAAKRRVRIASEGNYNYTSYCDIPTPRSRMSTGQFYADVGRKTNANRLSASFVTGDPNAHKRHVTNALPEASRQRNRSSPAKVLVSRQSQTARDLPVPVVMVGHPPPQARSRTLISLHGANNPPPPSSPFSPQQGVYKRVIDLR